MTVLPWLVMLVCLVIQYFSFRGRLRKKDVRIAELEHLLSSYRTVATNPLDYEDLRNLVPESPAGEAET
jgi:hypothetical protein